MNKGQIGPVGSTGGSAIPPMLKRQLRGRFADNENDSSADSEIAALSPAQKVRNEIAEALRSPLKAIERKPSVYRGKAWTAYKPGQDHRFPKNWVTRDERGNLCACVASRKDLIANAKLCEVKLSWANVGG